MNQIRVVTCVSLEEYYCVGALEDRGLRVIPVLRGSAKGQSDIAGPVRVQTFQDFFRKQGRSSFLSGQGASYIEQARTIWRCSDAVRRRSFSHDGRHVAVDRIVLAEIGPAAICAAFLAGTLGLRLQLIDKGFLHFVRNQSPKSAKFLLVGLPEQFPDPVLFEVLDQAAAGLGSNTPWENLPYFSLMTGRDLQALSWLVAKTLLSALQAQSTSGRLAYYEFPGCHDSLVRELLLERKGGQSRVIPRRSSLNGSRETLASYVWPSDAVVVATHGFESCADGGSGVVLCGLNPLHRNWEENASGILACARGYTCPRGPQPLPLRQLHSPVLMLASCNSFRLADSQLKSDFNLGLSFLDGQGQDYVSSPSTITHAPLCSVAFAAAMANGHTVSEATTLANGLIHCAGIDRPSFIGIGMGNYRIPRRSVKKIRRRASLPFTIDWDNVNHAEVFISERSLMELARQGLLILDTGERESQDAIFYFYRLEHMPASRQERHVLRVFFFSFPEFLGRLTIRSYELNGLRQAVDKAVEASSFWLDFVRLAALEAKIPQLPAISAGIAKSRANAARLLNIVRYEANGVQQLLQQIRVLWSFAIMARDLTLDYLMANVSGSFLLTNVWGEEYRNQAEGQSVCNNCGGRAFRKTLRQVMGKRGRVVVNCWRCGYVADLPESGLVQNVRIEAPELVSKGSVLQIQVTIETAEIAQPMDFRVWVRINAQAFGHLVPAPNPGFCEVQGKSGTVCFRVDLPEDLPPHGYAIRMLAASSEEIVFAARGIFVRNGH